MNRKKRWILAVILILAVLAAYVLVSLWVSTNYIVVREYTADTEKSETGFRAAVISDLHDHRFGGDNEKLAEEIRQTEPGICPAGTDRPVERYGAGLLCPRQS